MEPHSPQRDAPSSAQGPVPIFDSHLRVLESSYASFFSERRRIEEVYVESMSRLHKKIKSIDAYLDDRGEVSSARGAWNEIRDSFEREIHARQAFLSTLTVDILTPLNAFRETQDRTRKRIKEDLKNSFSTYEEYKEVTLPKLRLRYTRKFAEVEEQKRMPAQTPATATTTTANFPEKESHSNLSHSKTGPSFSPKPTVTSPQPLRAVERRPSGSAPAARNRSPSSSTAFSDLAHQGKRQFTQLIDSLGGNRENPALRNVRAKRDADEADKEYRKGVHWLETLRLRRIKTLESGYKSFELFMEESSTLVKQLLEKYADNMMATTSHQTQLAVNVREAVKKIVPERDINCLSSYVPKSLASSIPEPVLYYHAQVGPCNDLIFGFSLVDYATTKNLHEGEVPKIIRICIKEIEQRGLESEGIYRVSGRLANVQMLQREIEKDESKFEFKPQRDDVFVVASLLKLYLRELPEPVFRFPPQDRIQHSEDRAEHLSNNFALLKSKIRRLPPVHQATLKAILEHLSRVASLSGQNKMDPKNLAIVFGQVIFGEDEIPKGGDLLSVQTWKDTLMEDLILHSHVLYDETGVQNSPPLPPTPAGKPVPQFYGSKSTKVVTVPPSPAGSSQVPPSASSDSDDFAPRLPPRPPSSIHPSARAGAGAPSPVKDRSEPPPLPQRRTAAAAEPPELILEEVPGDDGSAQPDSSQSNRNSNLVESPLQSSAPSESATEEHTHTNQ